MEDQRKENISINNTTETNSYIDNNILSMDELIEKTILLSRNQNPYSVSKEIESIKSIFYIKLKAEEKKIDNSKELGSQEENIKKELNPLEIKLKSVLNDYRKIKSNFRKKKENIEKQNLKIKKQIIKDIDELVKEEESIKLTFEKFRILQKKWKNTGHVPITENNNLWQSFHHHVELFYDFIKINNDLRDLDFQRNLEEKSKICKKANALLNEKSINRAHQQLQELHEHWKNVGPVEKKYRENTWQEFQEISRRINKKRNDYFSEKKKQDSIKLEAKNVISTEIDNLSSEKITSHNGWQEATNKCNKLESKWKSLGRLNKENNKIAWKRLRDSLNNFYNTKNAFYKQKKESGKQILENKLTICKKAENLKESTDWQGTSKKIIKLQEEWKGSEFSPTKQSNEIWRRFRTACDTFFKAKKEYYKKIEQEEKGAYKEKESLIKAIERFKVSSDSKEDIEKLKKVNSQWKSIGRIPKNKMDINDVFLNLLNSKFEELGLSKKALETEQYKNKVSSLKGNNKAISNERQLIRKKIDILNKEITQYENNISFFGSGKSTEPLLQQAQKKIDNAKANIEDLKEKIRLLNKA